MRHSKFSVYMLERKNLANLELYGTAVLSMADMATDLVMISRFSASNNSGFALASSICIGISLLLQSIAVHAQNKKQPLCKQVTEQLIVWSCVKPGVDAYRVSTEKSEEAGQISTAKGEMTVIKAIELASESIPGTLIQALALLTGSASDGFSVMPLISLACSVLTSAVISTSISYEYDADSSNRRWSPSFYGFLPNGLRRKAAVLILLLLVSAFNLCVRTLTAILLYIRGDFELMLGVLSAELCLYLAVKAWRRDFYYHVPVYGVTGVFMSLSFRVISKVVTDWTAVCHFRHPSDVGGAYWTFTIFFNVLAGLVSATVFETTKIDVTTADENAGGRNHLDRIDVLKVMTACCFGLCMSFLLFLMSIKKKYIQTFLNNKSSCEHIIDKFMNNSSDQLKFKILQRNEYKWRCAIGEEVKAWLMKRLPEWIAEEPEWFTSHKRSCVPEWAIDNPSLLVQLRTRKVQSIIDKRRKSLVAVMGG